MSQTIQDVEEGSDENNRTTEIARRALLELVGSANCRDANYVGIDIRVEQAGPVIVIEDDGVGMKPSQLDDFLGTTEEERRFYGADEVHVVTTREGRTLKAHSDDPPEYDVTSMNAARWEEGTRVEIVNFTGPNALTKHLDEEKLREDLHLDESDWTALLNVQVEEDAHPIRRLGDDI